MDPLEKLYTKLRENVVHFPALLTVLADELGVSVDSLSLLGVGFYPATQSWVFPERDDRGHVIGLMQRFTDSKKMMVKGSKRGLTYALNHSYNAEEKKYVSGAHNWIRVSEEKPCPLCGKSDGCMLPASDPDNPPAIVCVHISEGAVKPLGLGYLHILQPHKNLRFVSLLFPSNYPVLVVEGASDVAAAMDLGFTAVGRPSAEGGMDLLVRLMRGRTAIIVGENDAGAGQAGMEATFLTLTPVCKSLRKVLPPEGIKDLREWKLRTDLTTESLLSYANMGGSTTANPDIFKDDIAHTIAETWLKQGKIKNNFLLLRNYRGDWVEHNGECYETLEHEQFRGQLYKFLNDKQYCQKDDKGGVVIRPYKPTRAKISDIVDALNDWCPILKDPPTWLTDDPNKPDAQNLIVFKNGILDVEEYLAGRIKLHKPTPEFFSFNVFPYNYDENTNSELWDEFLNQIFNGDKDKIMLLSQWFGYNCVPDMSYEKLMLFTGRPRSGKSTVLETMQNMLGSKQCCETSFQSLSGPFGYQPLLGNYAAVIGDAKSPKSGEANAVLEKILHITGGDAVSVNRKCIKELPMVHLNVRFTIAMNDLPVFTDHSRALEARLMVLLFENSYLGREDRSLKLRLKKEARAGKLINFALQGLKNLRIRKDFVIPPTSEDLLMQFRELSSPVITFVQECCEVGDNFTISKDQLYDVWVMWCKEQGRMPGLKQQFGRWFMAACPQVVTTRTKTGDDRIYTYQNMKLSSYAFKRYLGG